MSISTPRRWEAPGRPIADRVGIHRQYDLAKLRPEQFRVFGEVARSAIVHARLSSHDQRADLEGQKRVLELHCAGRGWTCEVVADLGSGVNDDERGLERLLDGIAAGEVGRLAITDEDRLLRFGAGLVFAICAADEVGMPAARVGASGCPASAGSGCARRCASRTGPGASR